MKIRCRPATLTIVGYLKLLCVIATIASLSAPAFGGPVYLTWAGAGLFGAFVVLHLTPFVVANEPPLARESDPAHVVTLVHGTFAMNADWTRPGSLLCQTLPELVNGRVVFEAFLWTGGNRMRDRTDAATELAGFLERLLAAYPNARHFVIAHSHGGNVARLALARLEHPEAVAGLVCLSTPFLIIQPRALGPYGILTLRGIVCAPMTLLLIFFIGFKENDLAEGWLGYSMLAGIFGTFLFFVVAPPLIESLLRRALIWVEQQPRHDAVSILAIRAPSDEASVALLGMQFAAMIMQRLWRAFAWCNRPFVAVVALAQPLVQELRSLPRKQLNVFLASPRKQLASSVIAVLLSTVVLLWLYIAIGIALAGISLVALAASIPLAVALLMMNLAGAGIGLAGLLLEVSAESSPVGRYSVLTLPSSVELLTPDSAITLRAGQQVVLAHSVHSRPDTVEAIAWFVERGLASIPTPRPS